MDEMKQAFDQVAEDGVVQPGLLLPVLRRRNPQATEADAQSLIEMMRSNEDEDVSFSGVCCVWLILNTARLRGGLFGCADYTMDGVSDGVMLCDGCCRIRGRGGCILIGFEHL